MELPVTEPPFSIANYCPITARKRLIPTPADSFREGIK
jgi:hypothetical protein